MGTIARGAKAGGGTNFNSGQVIDPSEVNDDFNTLYTEANGLLDDGNIQSGTVPGAKTLRFTEISVPSSPSSNDIVMYGADDTPSALTVVRTKDSAGNVATLSRDYQILNRDVTIVNVASTTDETTLYTYSVPAGTLGTNRSIRLSVTGTYQQASGSNRTFILRVKLGSTTLYTHTTGNLATSASTRGWQLRGLITAYGALNAQVSDWVSTVGALVTSGGVGAAPASTFFANNITAEDNVAALDLVITLQHSNNDATASCLTVLTEYV